MGFREAAGRGLRQMLPDKRKLGRYAAVGLAAGIGGAQLSETVRREEGEIVAAGEAFITSQAQYLEDKHHADTADTAYFREQQHQLIQQLVATGNIEQAAALYKEIGDVDKATAVIQTAAEQAERETNFAEAARWHQQLGNTDQETNLWRKAAEAELTKQSYNTAAAYFEQAHVPLPDLVLLQRIEDRLQATHSFTRYTLGEIAYDWRALVDSPDQPDLAARQGVARLVADRCAAAQFYDDAADWYTRAGDLAKATEARDKAEQRRAFQQEPARQRVAAKLTPAERSAQLIAEAKVALVEQRYDHAERLYRAAQQMPEEFGPTIAAAALEQQAYEKAADYYLLAQDTVRAKQYYRQAADAKAAEADQDWQFAKAASLYGKADEPVLANEQRVRAAASALVNWVRQEGVARAEQYLAEAQWDKPAITQYIIQQLTEQKNFFAVAEIHRTNGNQTEAALFYQQAADQLGDQRSTKAYEFLEIAQGANEVGATALAEDLWRTACQQYEHDHSYDRAAEISAKQLNDNEQAQRLWLAWAKELTPSLSARDKQPPDYKRYSFYSDDPAALVVEYYVKGGFTAEQANRTIARRLVAAEDDNGAADYFLAAGDKSRAIDALLTALRKSRQQAREGDTSHYQTEYWVRLLHRVETLLH